MPHGIKTTYEIVGEKQVIANEEQRPPKAGFRFGRMFPHLPAFRPTDASLAALGAQMLPGTDDDMALPAGYTYFGQFVDHDITRDGTLGQPADTIDLEPDAILQERSPSLDLDSLYGGPLTPKAAFFQDGDPVLFRIGQTVPLAAAFDGDPVGTALPNDLPRDPSGVPQIGDDRNDENLVVAQTHLAFLKFHNRIVGEVRAVGTVETEDVFLASRRLVTRHYQRLVLNDFVRRLVEPAVFEAVLGVADLTGVTEVLLRPKLFEPTGYETPPMPLEFSVAAYRLGHSMIRDGYSWNRVFPGASLTQLFQFTNTSGGLGHPERDAGPASAFAALPSNWVADWRRLFDFSQVAGFPPVDRTAVRLSLAKQLDTHMARTLAALPVQGNNLATRNLQRGSRNGLPAAQDVAAAMVAAGALTPDALIRPKVLLEGLPAPLVKAIREHEFDVKTPLWFYILREAKVLGDGQRLGPLGSRILVETFVALARCSVTSIFNANHDRPARLDLFSPEADSAARTPGGEPILTLAHLLAYVGDVNPLGDAPP